MREMASQLFKKLPSIVAENVAHTFLNENLF